MVAVLAVLVSIVGLASPAGAHTSLQSSTPADRSTLDQAPSEIRLVLTEPVDARTVSARLLRADGADFGSLTRTTPDGSTETIVFALPALEEGTYGVTWESIGDDGHRAAGEVVFGVGATSGAEVATVSFSSTSTTDRLLDVTATVGRFGWYLGLALLAGSLYVAWWLGRRAGDLDERAGPALLDTGADLAATGAVIALGGAAARWLATVVALARGYGEGRPGAGDLADAATTTHGMVWVATAFVLVAIYRAATRNAAEGRPPGAVVAGSVAGVVAVAVLGSVAGHALTMPAPGLAVPLQAAHLLAAALWVGPLAVVTVATRRAAWRAADPAPRRRLLGRFFTDYAPVAGWSFAVLLVTGARALWVEVGGDLLDSSYGRLLAVKLLAVFLVVVPLGYHHDRVLRMAAAGRRAATFGGRYLSSVRIEAGAMVGVLVLVAVLAGLDPGATSGGAGADPGVASGAPATAPATSDSPDDGESLRTVSDVAECADLAVGGRACYRDYFATVLRTRGADDAIAEIERLSASDPYVRGDCHQVTHDLGEDAAEFFPTLAEAFSVEASVCWSGYYHGVVETRLSQYDDAELEEAVPTVCEDAAKPTRYSFSHYNCVHGMGHGIMLRFEADLFRSLPYCSLLDDEWERNSCLGGVFMENVVSAQQGHVDGTFDDDDPAYPCTAEGLGKADREQCWLMQTSYVLWKNGYDWDAAFQVCDAADAPFDRTCYQSLGRDISGSFLLDVEEVIAHCDLGAEALQGWCYRGAALNSVYDQHDTRNATELCEAVAPRWRDICLTARDEAAATF